MEDNQNSTPDDQALCKVKEKNGENNGTIQGVIHNTNACCKFGPAYWCRKYFWEGQFRDKHEIRVNENDEISRYNYCLNFYKNHRKLVGIALPLVIYHIFWWGVVIKHDLWHHFKDRWYMAITMAFGSAIAGITSEGGGAVAFPVMTLAYKIEPSIARDFSIMIQSCGMTAATLTILIMGIKLEWNSLLWGTVGGVAGIIFGLEVIDPQLSPAQKKMGFVSIWFSFAFALFLLNRSHKRHTFSFIPNVTIWKVFVLILVGFVGGTFTSFAGSGLDICTFSVLTLLFRVSEKVATPTSVILMAGNSLAGFYWRAVMLQGISQEAWNFFTVCIPIVVIGAPCGSLLGSHFHRLVLAALIYIIDTVALIGAFILVPQTPTLLALSIGIILFGFAFFLILTKLGQVLLKSHRNKLKVTETKENVTNTTKSETNGIAQRIMNNDCGEIKRTNSVAIMYNDVENGELVVEELVKEQETIA